MKLGDGGRRGHCNKHASCPDWRISPHAGHHETQIVYNTGRHRASDGLFVTGSATVGRLCRTGLTTVKCLIDFSIFDRGGLPPRQRPPKGEMTYNPPRSTILQNFSTIAQTVYEICVTKFFSLFGPWGLTPGPKFTKRGDDLVDSEIYHLQNFIALRQPTPEISLTKYPADTQKNKQFPQFTRLAYIPTCRSLLPPRL